MNSKQLKLFSIEMSSEEAEEMYCELNRMGLIKEKKLIELRNLLGEDFKDDEEEDDEDFEDDVEEEVIRKPRKPRKRR